LKAGIVIGSIIAIAAVIFGSAAASTPVNTSAFLDVFYNWLWAKEGGLRYKIAGGEASLPKAPVGQNAQGEWPHTSRGITTPTFEGYYAAKGLALDWTKWLEFSTLDEPNQLWKDITTWRGRLSANFTSNPVLQRYISLYYFGGWDQNLVTVAQVNQILNSNDTLLMKFRQLVNLRKFYFDELERLGRASAGTVAHWKERAEDAYDTFKPFLPIV
jgi:hypothetical protein